jgi:hypothetical protein
MPALKVNIIIVHPRGVVFPEGFTRGVLLLLKPSGKQHPSGEQL